MSNIVYRVRAEEKNAAEREIEAWKEAHREAMLARDLEELLEKVLHDWQADEAFLSTIPQKTAGRNRNEIDEANRFIHEFCERSIRIHELVRECIRLSAALGHSVGGANRLTDATEDYRRWQEEYPEKLAMCDNSVRETIKSRIENALRNPPTESDWRRYAAEEAAAAPENP